MKNKKGFTLIELMVVIVILGILAAVVAPRIPQFVNKAKEGKTKGNLGTLRSTLNIYYGDNDGKYPMDNLACLSPKYLKQLPDAELPGSHLASRTVAQNGDNATIVVVDAGGWIYGDVMTQMSVWGNVQINCNAHSDSASNAWSGY